MCVEWAEMNETGIVKPDIVSDFKFRSKCMFGAELRNESRESLSAPDFIFRPQMHKKLWRPGFAWTRWGA